MMRSMMTMLKQAAKGFTLDAKPAAVELFNFNSPKVVDQWHVFTDAYFGGRSQAALVYKPLEQAAEFSGRVTLEQGEDADIKRAGYCVAASKVTHIADYFDLTGCTHLVLDVKGDGRTYIANVRTDSIAGTGGDIWQAPFRTRPDGWQRVSIPLESLLLTFQGQLVQRQLEFQANQVIAVGVAASAMPTAEAAVAAVSLDPPTYASSSGGSSSSGTSSSSTLDKQSMAQLQGAASSSHAVDSSSSGEVSTASSSSRDPLEGDSEQPDSSSWPEHERFRLLVRSIRAEVEW